MPELPEVTTTVLGLQKTILDWTIIGVWTDLAIPNPILQFRHTFKNKEFLKYAQKESIGQKIIHIERRAKNILITLSNKKIIVIHMKMTGHMMVGNYIQEAKTKKWIISNEEKNNALRDPYNRFIHVVWTLKKGNNVKHLVLCDSRKFAKITLYEQKELEHYLNPLGPEPLEDSFNLQACIRQIMKKPSGKIKSVLLDQHIISGIGNIYSDEILWASNIHPMRQVKDIHTKEYILLFKYMKEILQKGINFGGDSTSDYRNVYGEKGTFQGKHMVYRKTHTSCLKKKCTGKIERIVVNGRSAHFCPTHQT